MTLVLDAGALIAVERSDPEILAAIKDELPPGVRPLPMAGSSGRCGGGAGIARPCSPSSWPGSTSSPSTTDSVGGRASSSDGRGVRRRRRRPGAPGRRRRRDPHLRSRRPAAAGPGGRRPRRPGARVVTLTRAYSAVREPCRTPVTGTQPHEHPRPVDWATWIPKASARPAEDRGRGDGMNSFEISPRRTLVVVGNGMVGHKLLEVLLDRGATAEWDIVTFCEEGRLAYDRVGPQLVLRRDVGRGALPRPARVLRALRPQRPRRRRGGVDRHQGGHGHVPQRDQDRLRRPRPGHRLLPVRPPAAGQRRPRVLRLPHPRRPGGDPGLRQGLPGGRGGRRRAARAGGGQRPALPRPGDPRGRVRRPAHAHAGRRRRFVRPPPAHRGAGRDHPHRDAHRGDPPRPAGRVQGMHFANEGQMGSTTSRSGWSSSPPASGPGTSWPRRPG